MQCSLLQIQDILKHKALPPTPHSRHLLKVSCKNVSFRNHLSTFTYHPLLHTNTYSLYKYTVIYACTSVILKLFFHWAALWSKCNSHGPRIIYE